MTYLWATVGLVVLYLGARLLVDGASSLGRFLGISPVVIGLTIVAFGTSTPELVVSVNGALMGLHELALGNVLGSNIFNVLFILGVSACLLPLRVNRRLLQYEVPLALLLTLLVFALALNGWIGVAEGAFLVFTLVLYTAWLLREARFEEPRSYENSADDPRENTEPTLWEGAYQAGLTLIGLVVLILGSRLFTDAVTTLARDFGVPEIVIGLTIVSAGTSLPEVGASLMATWNGQTDIAVGNVIGSNVFNLTAVLGGSVLVSDGGFPISQNVLEYDFIVLLAVSVLCLPIFFTGSRISRWEGILFVLYYALYTVSLFGEGTLPGLSRTLPVALFVFAIPLTVLTLGVGFWRHRYEPRSGPE